LTPQKILPEISFGRTCVQCVLGNMFILLFFLYYPCGEINVYNSLDYAYREFRMQPKR